MVGVRIRVTGIVQGVGFRPFIYGLAKQYSLNGWVRNTSSGVDIVVEGEQTDLEHFVNAIRPEAPPLSHVEEILIDQVPANGYTDFEILHSQAYQDEFQPISPDVGICKDCLEELFDPNNRRFLYPFINCTNCGPRFTIIQDIPYDRPFPTGLTRGHDATPIVVDGVLYFTGTWSVVFAVDARTGKELWRYDPQVPKETGKKGC